MRSGRTGVRSAALVAVAVVGVAAVAVALRETGALSGGSGHRSATAAPVTASGTAAASAALAARSRPRRLHLPAVLPTGTITVPILMYHRIDHPAPGLPAIEQRLTVAPADFAAQMRWLRRNGYHGITERQLYQAAVHGRALPRRPVLVTFDDGYRDVVTYAVPVLARLHLPATVFVITDRTGNGAHGTWMTWADLHRMQALGFDVGSHSVSHRDLTALPSAVALAELRHSRRDLERHLGHPVQWFAYPFGGVNDSVAALARQAGYVLAVTTHGGRVQDRSRPLELHRNEVLDSTGVAGVAALVGG